MLAQLKAVHEELRVAIGALATETARAEPQETTLTAARLKLTRASSRRRSLIQCTILPHLQDVSSAEAAQLEVLRRDAAVQIVRSSEHIAHWTMREIMAEWAGYQRASVAMQAAMLRRIDEESAVLAPLLEQKAAAQLAAA